MVLTRTYRQSSLAGADAVAADPENLLFGRMNRRRMDAECIRDTILSVSGKLQLDRGGPGFKPALKSNYSLRIDTRRSVYVPVFRNALPELFEVFDFADPSVTTGRRNVSTVAPRRVDDEPPVCSRAAGIRRRPAPVGQGPGRCGAARAAYRLALGRLPAEAERRIALKFVGEQKENAWANLYQALFASMDFRYVN